MQYVLLVFLEFKKYKEPINLQIFANNRLIDDIDLEESISVRKKLLVYARNESNIFEIF